MASLGELQSAFVDGVLYERAERACAWIADKGLAPERRLAIYRNNAREGFLKTLAAGFPVVERLGGEDWFRQTGRAYMRAHPSRSGNLHHIGERFAGFLRQQLEHTPFAYFADVAELEWAYQEVLVAADAEPLTIDALRTVQPEEYESLRFSAHPAARLVASSFPILAIWKANQAEDAWSSASAFAPSLTLPRSAGEGTGEDSLPRSAGEGTGEDSLPCNAGKRTGEDSLPCSAEGIIEDSLPCDAGEGQGGGENVVRLDAGASRVLVIRRADHVELRELSAAEFALANAFHRGETFAEAAESMLAANAGADLGAVFARIVQLGALSGLKVREAALVNH